MEKISLARRAKLEVTIDGHNATSYLEPSLLSFEYVDQAADKSDEIQISLHDRDDRWIGGYLPLKGSVITAKIICLNWHKAGESQILECGSFQCDEPADYQGPPNKVSIKAISATLTNELRETSRTKAWENYSLKGIAQELAAKHKLELYYDAEEHQFKRQDQRREADLPFLQRLAKARGINLKVHDGKMILFEAEKADTQSPYLTINRRNGDFFTAIDYSFKISSDETGYEGAKVDYHDPETRQVKSYEYRAEGKEKKADEKILTMDNRVESQSEAITLSKSRLRQANQKELTGSFSILGYPGLVSGMTINLEDFGIFSGKYFVEKATHQVGDKYITSAEIRQTLDY